MLFGAYQPTYPVLDREFAIREFDVSATSEIVLLRNAVITYGTKYYVVRSAHAHAFVAEKTTNQLITLPRCSAAVSRSYIRPGNL